MPMPVTTTRGSAIVTSSVRLTTAARLDERKERLVESIRSSCVECCRTEQLVLHVGRDPPDLKQLAYLPEEAHGSGRLKVVKHNVAGHALGAGLKEQGLLRKTILRDLLGHSYRLPPAGGL